MSAWNIRPDLSLKAACSVLNNVTMLAEEAHNAYVLWKYAAEIYEKQHAKQTDVQPLTCIYCTSKVLSRIT